MSTAACILANISLDLGRSLQWDHAKGVVVGDEEANKRLRRPAAARGRIRIRTRSDFRTAAV